MNHKKYRAKQYSKERHRAGLAKIFATPAVISLMVISGLGNLMQKSAFAISENIYVALCIYLLFFQAAYYLLTSPLSYYSEYALEHKFSLSNQNPADWLRKKLKEVSLSFIISLPLAFTLYFFLRYATLYWWLYTAAVWFMLSVVIAGITPAFIVPLFYRYSPIKDGKLKDRIDSLVSKVGFRTEGVYEIDISRETKKANAAVIGLGNGKRIILCDTLMKNFTTEEIESVMGHELGHHKLHHSLKLILWGGLSTLLIFYFSNEVFLKIHPMLGYEELFDLKSLLLLYGVISWLSVPPVPLSNWLSRKLEKDADAFTLKLTRNRDAFISAMTKLSKQNLSDPDPGGFYEIMLYTHPPVSKRIEMAE